LPSDDPAPRRSEIPDSSASLSGSTHDSNEPFWLSRIHEIARELLTLEDREPVARSYAPQELSELEDIKLRERGRSSSRVMDDLAMVARRTPKTNTNRFFNQLFAGRDGVGTAAEVLTALLNSSMYTHKIAGINAHIEDEVIRELLALVGYADGDGSFYPGGSISNLVSLVLARDAAMAQTSPTEPTDLGRFTAYTSECCHYSVLKNAHLAGIPRENVRKVPTDAEGRMDPAALAAMIQRDQESGCCPFFINATSGTTVMGAFDPLPELADIAERVGIWFHVDAALGGGVLFSKEHRHLIDGCERADSFAWCAHKMMGVPLSCSVLLVKRRGALEECLAADAGYLFQAEDQSMDFGQKSIQCGRRNDALKLWTIWRHRGHSGMGARVDRLFELAQLTAEKVRAHPDLELVHTPESTNVCLRIQQADPAEVCRRLEEERLVLVGHAEVKGESIIRIPHPDPEISEADLDYLLEAIVEVDAAYTK
jgi:glutamate/tyrosine decarboxylase-like PLP-dependent enzyme